MKTISAFIGIKKRINDIFGWKTDTTELTSDSIQEAVTANMMRYGKAMSGMNNEGCVLGNFSGAVIASFSSGTFRLSINTTMVTNKGRIINMGVGSAVLNGISGNTAIYYLYTDKIDPDSELVNIQSGASRRIGRDEVSHIDSNLSAQLTTSQPVGNVEYVKVGYITISPDSFTPNYPRFRDNYKGTTQTPYSINVVTDLIIETAGNETTIKLTRSKLTLVDGLIRTVEDTSDSVDSITITADSTSSDGATITTNVNVG